MNTDMLLKAKEIQDWVVKLRRDFHQHPEASLKEVRTSKIVVNELEKLGIEVKRIGETGVIGLLKGSKEGKVVGLRADMDALSVTEDTGLDYSSEISGFMHGCGHDCHTAMLLGAAKILSQMKDTLKGSVKFIFQPAEELACGAKLMVEGGALENPKLDYIFGMHIWSDIITGKACLEKGALMAGGDIWDLTVKGESCHGSSPWQGVDAITCSAAIIQGVQTIVSRVNDVRNPIVINIGTINGGERMNVTPGMAKLEGMNRTFNSHSREMLPKWLEELIKNTCTAYGCKYNFNYKFVCAPVINDPKATEFARTSVCKIIGNDNIPTFQKVMGSEDFSEYLNKIPGTLMLLGCRNEEKDCCYSHHSNHFKVDEDSFPLGVASYVQVAYDYLMEH